MSLDNTRNRTLQLNLFIGIASFALMMSTVPASFFGMNLHSGIEVRPDRLLVLFLWDCAPRASGPAACMAAIAQPSSYTAFLLHP